MECKWTRLLQHSDVSCLSTGEEDALSSAAVSLGLERRDDLTDMVELLAGHPGMAPAPVRQSGAPGWGCWEAEGAFC